MLTLLALAPVPGTAMPLEQSGLAGRWMHVAVRPDRALGTGRGSIIDDAVGIDGEVDHAALCSKNDLRLRPRHCLIGNHIPDGATAVRGRIIVMRLAP